jgi:hypothetical protein
MRYKKAVLIGRFTAVSTPLLREEGGGKRGERKEGESEIASGCEKILNNLMTTKLLERRKIKITAEMNAIKTLTK